MQESSVFKEIKALNSELDKAEKERQFYVAATRAKDRLILSGVTKTKGDKGTWFKNLKNILSGYEGMIFTDVDAAEILPQEMQAEEDTRSFIGEDVIANTLPLPEYGKAWQQSFRLHLYSSIISVSAVFITIIFCKCRLLNRS